MSKPTRQETIDATRKILDFLEAHPDFKIPYALTEPLNVYAEGKDSVAAMARMLGSGKKTVDSDFFRFTKDFGGGTGLMVIEFRSSVCERVVVGTREVESEEADPVAVAALPKLKVKKQVEIVEWICPDSLLGNATAEGVTT